MVLFNVNNILFQYVLSQESSKPLRQTLEAHSLKLVNSTFSIPQVRELAFVEIMRKIKQLGQTKIPIFCMEERILDNHELMASSDYLVTSRGV